MRPITVGLLALSLTLASCESRGEPMQEDGSAASSETITLEGKVHCGSVRACTGESFLVYTEEYGGKVIMVIPTASRSAADVKKRLADGVRVEIAGIEKSKVRIHQYNVSADQITFLPRED